MRKNGFILDETLRYYIKKSGLMCAKVTILMRK